MSDSKDSTVTYTAASSPFEGLSNIGSPGVDGPPMMPEDSYAYVVASFQAPPSPEYVPSPEEPKKASPLPEFVPKPVYPEFMQLEDDVLLDEEQPLPATVSPIADSPGYIPESDLEEDDDEDPEKDLADYPTDRDDEEEEPSEDKADDKNEDEDDDQEEEDEHPAPANSVPPPPVHRTTARISILAQALIQFLSEEELVSPPLPISPPPLPASPTYPLGFRAAMIRQRAESPSTSHSLPLPPPIILSHTRAPMAMMMAASPSTYILAPPSRTPPLLPISLPTPLPPLLLPSTDRREDMPEVCLPPRKRTDYGFVATLDAEIRRDPGRNVGYGITDT
ncbi:hypothetical protein Tco_1542496 [Tanacetum coccineum]